MAKFNAFDEQCDLSVVLILLGSMPVFSPAIQAAANDLRDQVRNNWAHCNFTEWDAAKFQRSFKEMDVLIQKLGLTSDVEAKLLKELHDWKTKGTTLCTNSPKDPQLLELVQKEIAQMKYDVEHYCFECEDERMQLKLKLKDVEEHFQTQIDRLHSRINTVEGDLQEVKNKIRNLGDGKKEANVSGENHYFIGVPDRNTCFAGREAELAILNQKFSENKTSPDEADSASVQHQMLAISGLGGVGKTATAIEFAWRARGYYPGGIFWLSGESDEMLSKSICQLTELLGDDMERQLEKKEDMERIQKEEKVVNILTQKFNRLLLWLHKRSFPWLMVVDNTDHLELTPYMYELLRGTWKRESRGDILVSSRCKSEELQEVLKLQPTNIIIFQSLTVCEAAVFLVKRVDELSEDVIKLAKELDGLPLALEQAATYIKVVKCTVKEYLDEYHEQRLKLLNKKKSCPISEIFTKDRLAIHTTWQVNIEHISKGGGDLSLGKATLLMVKICAFLFSDIVPIEVVNGGKPEVDDHDFCRFARKPFGQKQIIDLMTRFSLFQKSPDLNSLSVHRLVQEVIRERCELDGTRDFVLLCAVKVLHKAFCDTFTAADLICWWVTFSEWLTENTSKKPMELPSPSTGGLWLKLAMNSNSLRSHLVNFVNENNAKHLWFTKETARLMRETALYFCHFRNFTESRNCYRALLRIFCGLKTCPSDNELDKGTRNFCLGNEIATYDFTSVFGSWSTSLRPLEELKDFISYTEQQARNAFAHGNYEQCCALIDLICHRSDTSEVSNATTGVYTANVNPKHATLYNYRAASLLKLERYEEALNDVQKWLKYCPDLLIAQELKVFVLCMLAKENMLRWRTRARAAMAVLIHSFGKDKGKKLENQFPQILDNVLFVTVSSTEELLLALDKNEGDENIYIFTGESYQVDELVCKKGCISFVGLPGKLARLHVNSALFLSSVDREEAQAESIYLMENLHVAVILGGFVCFECVFQATECLFELSKYDNRFFYGRFLRESIKSSFGEISQKQQAPYALLSGYGMKEVFISNSKFAGLLEPTFIQLPHSCCGAIFTRSSVTLKGNIVNQFYFGLEISDCNNSDDNLLFGNFVSNCCVGIMANDISNTSFVENEVLTNTQGLILCCCKATKVVQNTIGFNGTHGVIALNSDVTCENNIIYSNNSWGVVISFKSNLDMKLNEISDNSCGGVRILLNDSGVVTLQNNVIRNLGPSVFPIDGPPLLEQQFMEYGSSDGNDCSNFRKRLGLFYFPLGLFDCVNKFKPRTEIDNVTNQSESVRIFCDTLVTNIVADLYYFQLRYLDDHTKFSFNPPRLIDNVTNHYDRNALRGKSWLPELCCFCHSRLNQNPFKCETCLLSRYCGEKCYLKHAGHRTICQALLSISTVELETASSQKTHLTKLCGKTVVLRQRVDKFEAIFEQEEDFDLQYYVGDLNFTCLFTPFQEQLLRSFQNIYGLLEPSRMLQVTDSYVYAKLENNGKICRVFLLEPAPAFLFNSP